MLENARSEGSGDKVKKQYLPIGVGGKPLEIIIDFQKPFRMDNFVISHLHP